MDLGFSSKFTDASGVMERAMFLVLNFSSFGTTRKVHSSEFEIDADKEYIRASKILLSGKETEAIRSFDGHTKKWVESQCLPFDMRSVHVLPYLLAEDVDTYLEQRHGRREELVTVLLDAYPTLKRKDKERLGGVFNDKDYPTVAQVREQYQMRWKYTHFSTPNNLKTLNRGMFEREREKNVQMWAEAGAAADKFLQTCMTSLVNHMIDSLKGKKDGKKKKFHASTITNINDFLSTFNPRNVNNNEELKDLSDRLKAAMDGIDIKDLKTNQSTQEYVLAKFSQVKKQLDTMMVDRPRRMITFEDEDATATV